jgi:hypothetical protein
VSAIGAVLLLGLAGAMLIVAGVFLLAGTAWSLIAAGAGLFIAALFIRSGIEMNG